MSTRLCPANQQTWTPVASMEGEKADLVGPQAPRVYGGAEAKLAATSGAFPIVLIADRVLGFQCGPPDFILFLLTDIRPIVCKRDCTRREPQPHCGSTIPGAQPARSRLMDHSVSRQNAQASRALPVARPRPLDPPQWMWKRVTRFQGSDRRAYLFSNKTQTLLLSIFAEFDRVMAATVSSS